MKFIRLTTATKLYLLTLLLIFGILFLNQSAFAQETKSTTSQKRLNIMERYLSWIESNQYGNFQTEQGKKILADFKSFLEKSVPEGKTCLINPPSDLRRTPTFSENIETFFSGLISQNNPAPQPSQPTSCKGQIKDDYKLAKKYNRALKYLQIEAGQPNICVRADLGIGTALRARGFNPAKANSDNPKETGKSEPLDLYLCTGNDGKKKVRVVDDSGTRLRLSSEDAAKDEFKVENLPPKGAFDQLLAKLGEK